MEAVRERGKIHASPSIEGYSSDMTKGQTMTKPHPVPSRFIDDVGKKLAKETIQAFAEADSQHPKERARDIYSVVQLIDMFRKSEPMETQRQRYISLMDEACEQLGIEGKYWFVGEPQIRKSGITFYLAGPDNTVWGFLMGADLAAAKVMGKKQPKLKGWTCHFLGTRLNELEDAGE